MKREHGWKNAREHGSEGENEKGPPLTEPHISLRMYDIVRRKKC